MPSQKEKRQPKGAPPDISEQYFHCARCISEMPEDQSPREWARLSIAAVNGRILEVRCVRHDLPVITLFAVGDRLYRSGA